MLYLQPMPAELALLVFARCEHLLVYLEGSRYGMWKLLSLKDRSCISLYVRSLGLDVALSSTYTS